MLEKEKFIPLVTGYYTNGKEYVVSVKINRHITYYCLGKDNRPLKSIEKDIEEAFNLLWGTIEGGYTMEISLHREIALLNGWKQKLFFPL